MRVLGNRARAGGAKRRVKKAERVGIQSGPLDAHP